MAAMNYKEAYNQDYFNGKKSFFYAVGYGNPVQKLYFKSLYQPLTPFLEKMQTGRVLDIGCAYGFMLEKFPDTFEKHGIDISEHAISYAKSYGSCPVNVVNGAAFSSHQRVYLGD
jgi:2-polyprenyl-3-methyl-5-hydroxy-6-metoxy-1,4-benzoquinol methylase